MKNKLFLAFLPVALILSSCSPAPKAVDVMKEDTTAHAEIFGEAESIDAPLMKNPARRSAEDYVVPQVGVQFHSYTENNNSYYAVRFVARIASYDVDAKWTRAVSREDSNQIRAMSDYEATVAYTSINDGGNILYPYTLDNSYTRFVVYTMYKIPATDAANYRIMAYLTLYDSTEGSTIEPVVSKAVIASVNGNRAFAVNLDEANGKYFLEGRIGGHDNQIVYQDKKTLRNNKASFENVTFASGDKYGMFKLDTKSKTFQFFGKTTFFATASSFVSPAEGIGEYNSPKSAGSYTFFVSDGADTQNFVYIVNIITYTITNVPNWVPNNEAEIFAWIESPQDGNRWVKVTGNYSNGNVTVPASEELTKIMLVRCVKGTTEPSWSATGDNTGRIYNQTNDMTPWSGNYSYSESWKEYNPS